MTVGVPVACPPQCGFCKRGEEQGKHLFVGSKATICAYCVAQFAGKLIEQAETDKPKIIIPKSVQL